MGMYNIRAKYQLSLRLLSLYFVTGIAVSRTSDSVVPLTLGILR